MSEFAEIQREVRPIIIPTGIVELSYELIGSAMTPDIWNTPLGKQSDIQPDKPEADQLIAFRWLTAKLERQLITDDLTGLANNNGLRNIIEELPANRRNLILFVDADAFKDVNAELGHDDADYLLSGVIAPFLATRKLRNEEGAFARRSGDEFVGVFPIEQLRDRRTQGREEEASRRHRDDSVVQLESRLTKEWDEYVDTYSGPHRTLLDRANAVGFGLTIGAVMLQENATFEEAEAAIKLADELMERQKVIQETKALDPPTARRIIGIDKEMHELGITPRKLPRLIAAAHMVTDKQSAK